MAEPRRAHPSLDIAPKPLSIRSFDFRRPDVMTRVRGEFFEMRGFSPTVEQAARHGHSRAARHHEHKNQNSYFDHR